MPCGITVVRTRGWGRHAAPGNKKGHPGGPPEPGAASVRSRGGDTWGRLRLEGARRSRVEARGRAPDPVALGTSCRSSLGPGIQIRGSGRPGQTLWGRASAATSPAPVRGPGSLGASSALAGQRAPQAADTGCPSGCR